MSNDRNDEMPKTNASDIVAMVARGGLGAVPVAGAALAEIVTVLIPNQRSERVEAYIKALAKRLDGIVARVDALDLADPWKIDLFEEGAFQAARTVTDQRRDYIVSVVSRGLTGNDLATSNARTMLNIMKELDERQIIILASHLPGNDNPDRSFYKKHSAVLDIGLPLLGSPPDVKEKQSFHRFSIGRLVTLNLLHEVFRTDDLRLPQLDNSGRPEVLYRRLTLLGAQVLQHIGFDVDMQDYY